MIQNVKFERKFSRNFKKDLKLPLAEMKFGSLPLTTPRGDIYPILSKSGSFCEYCSEDKYFFKPEGRASVSRLIGRFNPYSTYEVITDKVADGAKIGIFVSHKDSLFVYAEIDGTEADIFYSLSGKAQKIGRCAFESGDSFLVTFHVGVCIETYVKRGEVIKNVGNANVAECECLISEDVFSSTDAALYIESEAEISVSALLNYVDSGIMQADVKPVKYENGDVIVEQGKIYLTYTSRYEERGVQQVMSYKLSTCEVELVGQLLFDSGDGKWCADVASSIMYDRNAKIWRIWVCVFSHGHRYAYAETKNDLRFGVNVVDVTPVPWVEDQYAFGGFRGDEDPDFMYVEDEKKWYLAMCRLDPECDKYRYYLFRSDRADAGYEYVSRTEDSIETTGGRFANFNGKTYFVFGRAFGERAKYDVCSFPEMKKLGELQCNHDDGGFRGWGSVFEIPCGTRKRLLWTTFDRTLGSSYNWSYGNFYFYESPTMKI